MRQFSTFQLLFVIYYILWRRSYWSNNFDCERHSQCKSEGSGVGRRVFLLLWSVVFMCRRRTHQEITRRKSLRSLALNISCEPLTVPRPACLLAPDSRCDACDDCEICDGCDACDACNATVVCDACEACE